MRRAQAIFALTLAGAVVSGCGSSGSKADGPGGHGAAGTGAAGFRGGGGIDGSASDRPATTDGPGGESARDGARDSSAARDAPTETAADAKGAGDAQTPCRVAVDGGTMACTNSIVSGNDNDFFCGLKDDGRINCWGSDPSGAYLVGPYGFLMPAIAKAPDHLVQLAVTNGIGSSNGEAFCGVDNLGRGTCWDATITKDMGGGLKAIVLSEWGTCMLDSNGAVTCGPEFLPAPSSAVPFTKILASEDSIAALDQAGVPRYPNDTFPSGTYTDIATNDNDRVGAVRSDGTAVSIVLGDDPIVKSGSFTHIALDYEGRACALDRAGEVTCWIAAPAQNPAPLGALPAGPFVQIVGAEASFCGLRDTGTTTCWGDNPVDVPAGW
jgi:hypothetical protein